VESLEALLKRASVAARNGDWAAAADAYETASETAPQRTDLHFNLGDARERAGDTAGAAEAYLGACRLSSREARLALFAGVALAAAGRNEEAAVMCSLADGLDTALLTSHKRQGLHPELRRRAAIADELLRRTFASLHAHAVDEAAAANPDDDDAGRIRRAIWVQTHPEPVEFRTPLQRPGIFYVPELPALEVTPTARLPWAASIEACTSDIREEYLSAVAAGARLDPYVEADVRNPLWGALRGRQDWSALHLFKSAEAQPIRPMEVFFSRLAPGTHIPPHHGVANHRITVHLPLIVPEGCAIRVGTHTHVWEEGRLFAFDDSFEHEAWNRGTRERVVLIFESFHPDLSAPERRAIEHSYALRGRWLAERRIPPPPSGRHPDAPR
jgi:tetratricopeptide (TPR) repeat protein